MLTAINTFSAVSVNDIAAARAFYIDTLELKLINDAMGLDIELPGGARFYVYEKADHTPADFTVLNFVVESIDDTIDHLVGHHGIVLERYEGMPWSQDDKGVLRGKAAGYGPDIAWFKDPAGNILSVVED